MTSAQSISCSGFVLESHAGLIYRSHAVVLVLRHREEFKATDLFLKMIFQLELLEIIHFIIPIRYMFIKYINLICLLSNAILIKMLRH